MNEKTTRLAIIILTVFTALVHLVFLNFRDFSQVFVVGSLNQLFFLNGLAYFVLLAAVIFKFPGQQRLVHYAFIAFTAVTIMAWYAVNREQIVFGLGVITKIVEAMLILALLNNLKYLRD